MIQSQIQRFIAVMLLLTMALQGCNRSVDGFFVGGKKLGTNEKCPNGYSMKDCKHDRENSNSECEDGCFDDDKDFGECCDSFNGNSDGPTPDFSVNEEEDDDESDDLSSSQIDPYKNNNQTGKNLITDSSETEGRSAEGEPSDYVEEDDNDDGNNQIPQNEKNNFEQALQELYEEGYGSFNRKTLEAKLQKGCLRYPLHDAANYSDILERLIGQKKYDINEGNKDGDTPLHIACMYANLLSFVVLLNQPGIDINVQNKWGMTPLHEIIDTLRESTSKGHMLMLRKLIERPDINPLLREHGGGLSFLQLAIYDKKYMEPDVLDLLRKKTYEARKKRNEQKEQKSGTESEEEEADDEADDDKAISKSKVSDHTSQNEENKSEQEDDENEEDDEADDDKATSKPRVSDHTSQNEENQSEQEDDENEEDDDKKKSKTESVKQASEDISQQEKDADNDDEQKSQNSEYQPENNKPIPKPKPEPEEEKKENIEEKNRYQ